MGLNSSFRAKFFTKSHRVDKNGDTHKIKISLIPGHYPGFFTNNEKMFIKGKIILQTHLKTYPKIIGQRGVNRQKQFSVLKVAPFFPPQSNKAGENYLTSNHVHMKQLEPSRKNPDHGFWAVSQLVVFLREAHLRTKNTQTFQFCHTLGAQ